MNWDRLEGSNSNSVLSKRALHLAKLYIVHILSKKAWDTVTGHFESIIFFDRWLSTQVGNSPSSLFTIHSFNWSSFDENLVRAFQNSRSKQVPSGSQDLSRLRGLYAWGVARRFSDFSPGMLGMLKSIKVSPIPRGRNVRIRHPAKGPFTPDEILLITNAIKAGRGANQDRAIVMLHLELGINPHASVQLLNQHLKRYDNENSVYYQLDVPRIKKRTVHLETKRRPISEELGNLLISLQRNNNPEELLLYWLAPSQPERAITKAMHRFAKTAKLTSPQTNALLNLHPRRFRYTLATYMAEEGASKYHIAEVLDHTDLQCVDVYVETVSSISTHVAKATDPKLKPLINRFLGKIIESSAITASTDNTNAIIPAATPHLPLVQLNLGGVGVCGRDIRKDGLCRLFPPLSCYLCPSFAAFRSGPHQELLESLDSFIAEMEGILDKRILRQLDEVRSALREVTDQLKLDSE